MAALKALAVLVAPFLMHAGNDGYTGSKACAGCHTEIYKTYEKTAMGRSMSPASSWKEDRLPREATLTQPGSARVFAVTREESGWRQRESEAGVFSVEYPLEYVIGSGVNGLTFLIRRGDYLFQAPLSYYAKTGKWDFSPGYEQVNLGFGRAVPEECVDCHAGRASPIQGRPGAYSAAVFQELAVGCENCHGPGEAHVKSGGKKAGAIVNPAKLNPRLAENICLNCHQGGDARVTQPGRTFLDFRPGEWLFNTAAILKQPAANGRQEADLLEHNSAMQASRCFRESGGKLSCLSCHDPHMQPREENATAYYRSKCLTCHDDRSCSLPVQVRAAKAPANNCVGCHMPKRNVLEISHSALTNHRIPAREGEPVAIPPQQEVDGMVVLNAPTGRSIELSKTTLLRAYQELAPKNPEYQQRYSKLLNELSSLVPRDAFVEAALAHQAFGEGNFGEAVAHFKLALPLGYPVIYRELGQSLLRLDKADDGIEYLKRGIEADPYDAAMQKELIVQYIKAKWYGEARIRLEHYVETFPEDSFMRNMLLRVSK